MSRASLAIRIAALSVVAITTACTPAVRPPSAAPRPGNEWGQTLARARTLAEQGQPARADSLLVDYAASHGTAPEAMETNYWRALILLQTREGTPSAVVMLSAYLDAGRGTEHALEAEALLHAVTRFDTLSRWNAKSTADAHADAKTAVADTKAQDEEIRRLKDELAKAKDELERIKKRLAEPPKTAVPTKPPTKPPA